MTQPLSRKHLLMAVLAGIVLAGGLGDPGRGEQPGAGGDKPKPRLTLVYYGVSVCADCHEDPRKKNDDPILCRCNESRIWEEHDKHRDAYKALLGERARDMGALLKIADVSRDATCLSCHGIVVRDEKSKHESFRAEDGVSCVVCHGAYAEWVDEHGSRLKRAAWRKRSRKEKEESYGMTDLWDPVRRTRLCVSCHVGNRDEGKVVTHAMYAAGHPPLPGFEPATFSNAMPRHWQYLREKPEAVRKLLDHDPAVREEAELVAVGGVVTYQEAMRLLAAEAKAAVAAGTMLDLAHFDCTACHHELRSPGWRQTRSHGGKPGQPQGHEWPAALLAASIRHAEGFDEAATVRRLQELRERTAELRRAFGARPFGDARQVAEAAARLADWSAALLERMGKEKLDDARARRFLRELTEVPPGHVPDYDSARQIAWALRSVRADLEKPTTNDGKVRAVLNDLDRELRLDLPTGRAKNILKAMEESLKARSGYDPVSFGKRLETMRLLLKE